MPVLLLAVEHLGDLVGPSLPALPWRKAKSPQDPVQQQVHDQTPPRMSPGRLVSHSAPRSGPCQDLGPITRTPDLFDNDPVAQERRTAHRALRPIQYGVSYVSRAAKAVARFGGMDEPGDVGERTGVTAVLT